jgi:hypothetical protein
MKELFNFSGFYDSILIFQSHTSKMTLAKLSAEMLEFRSYHDWQMTILFFAASSKHTFHLISFYVSIMILFLLEAFALTTVLLLNMELLINFVCVCVRASCLNCKTFLSPLSSGLHIFIRIDTEACRLAIKFPDERFSNIIFLLLFFWHIAKSLSTFPWMSTDNKH